MKQQACLNKPDGQHLFNYCAASYNESLCESHATATTLKQRCQHRQ